MKNIITKTLCALTILIVANSYAEPPRTIPPPPRIFASAELIVANESSYDVIIFFEASADRWLFSNTGEMYYWREMICSDGPCTFTDRRHLAHINFCNTPITEKERSHFPFQEGVVFNRIVLDINQTDSSQNVNRGFAPPPLRDENINRIIVLNKNTREIIREINENIQNLFVVTDSYINPGDLNLPDSYVKYLLTITDELLE